MATEKKIISLTVKVGLVLFAVCILAPVSLMVLLRHAVPLQTLRLLFSAGSASLVAWEEVKMYSANKGAFLCECDMSSLRSDVCELKGDVRVIPSNITIIALLHPSVSESRRSWRMKPHARKNDGHALASVTEVLVSVTPSSPHVPECKAESAAPAVVFSVGAYAGNMFHDFTDVLIPLFITASRFRSDVHLLVSDAPPWWLDKYRPLLRGLSHHAVIDMDRQSAEVLCTLMLVVGLSFHKEMSIDTAKTVVRLLFSAGSASLVAWEEVKMYSANKGAFLCECDMSSLRSEAESAAPAVVFSVGAYAGNMFHDFTDVLIPLFITASRFRSDVHLLASDAPPWWLDKYRPLLRGLSHHAVIDMDRQSAEVLCYPHVVVGLSFHKEMSIDTAKTVGGHYSMADFARLARRSYGLERDTAIRLLHGSDNIKSPRRPRLLIISRKTTRAFTNMGAVAQAAAMLGYEVIVGEAEQHSDLPAFARLVNSCDVLVGVHGAGLTNLVFLPPGAVVVQVVPLGGLEAMARDDFGEPAGDMGLGYVQYGISVGESTLAELYPRDRRVLRDLALRSEYLVSQNVTLDVARFSGALSRALELLHH
uniref:Putative glycosyltransferase AGO61 n=1 Tax=Aegilops tauschii TaxID=37682 RepID=M8C8T5_AEGTA